MISLTVLAVGLDLPKAMKKTWEARGVFLSLAHSPGEAIPLLRYGDFDLCLLGRSISQESRAKLVSLLRHSLHSTIPIVSLTDDVERTELFAEGLSPVQRSDTSRRSICEFLSEARAMGGSATGHHVRGHRPH
jgi:CheY-like chemotaxis protein